jgi:imidazole glycerol-phosphate synthase subunit HisH
MDTIAIIDYGMGNLRSVQKALEKLGHQAMVTASPHEIEKAPRVILPGVGAFGAAMANLTQATEEGPSLADAVRQAVSGGKPFLGICLGMQLLLSASEEMGSFAGLEIIPGTVAKFRFEGEAASELKVPHMGWNALTLERPIPILRGIESGQMAYFVHSYYCVPRDPEWVAATTTHGIPFCSVLGQDHVIAAQFHPEKSGAVGMRMLDNFATLPLRELVLTGSTGLSRKP